MRGSVAVSVVIPARNAAAWLPEQLESLARQVGALPFEVIVCDNGSADDPAAVVEGFADRLAIRLIDASGAPSASWARNVGAKESRGAILLFCDADDIVNPGWVAALTRAVQADSNAIASGALHHERFNSQAILDAYDIGPDPVLHDEPAAVVESQPVFAGLLPTVPGGNFAISRAAYLDLGGMDSSYPGGSEETDFSWRAQMAGMRVVGVPDAVVHYRLKKEWRGLFQQQRVQQRGRMLLWARFGDNGMSGPSWRYSIQTAIVAGLRFVMARTEEARLRQARILGGNVGAIEGMLRYRLLRRIPPKVRL